jgi:hypothetical protein
MAQRRRTQEATAPQLLVKGAPPRHANYVALVREFRQSERQHHPATSAASAASKPTMPNTMQPPGKAIKLV